MILFAIIGESLGVIESAEVASAAFMLQAVTNRKKRHG